MLAQGEAKPKASETLGKPCEIASKPREGRQTEPRSFLSPFQGLFSLRLGYPGFRLVFDLRFTLG